MKSKRHYALALKLMYMLNHKNRQRGIHTRTNKAFKYVLKRYGHDAWVELGKKQNIYQ